MDDKDQTDIDGSWATPTLEELLAFGQEHFAKGFPNPERIGCPDQGVLEDLVESGHAPDESLRGHVFQCSECFVAYRNMLHLRVNVREHLRQPARFAPRWLSVAAVVIIITSGGVVWLIRQEPQVAAVKPRAVVASNLPVPNIPQKVSGETKPPNAITIPIDLDSYAPYRDSTPNPGMAASKIRLPRGRLRLLLHLPEGRLPGGYVVRVLDDMEQLLTISHVHSIDGTSLTLLIDTTALPDSTRRLSIEHPDQAPLDYPIFITPANEEKR